MNNFWNVLYLTAVSLCGGNMRIFNPESILNIVEKSFKYHCNPVFRMIFPPKKLPAVTGISCCFFGNNFDTNITF